MFVAATSRCFANLPMDEALLKLVDLEYTCVELMLHETGGHIRPSEVLAEPDRALKICRQTHRLTPIALSVDIEAVADQHHDQYFEQFAACCRLAKALKIITLVVRSAELGTPFNAEVERLQEMSRIASADGIRVGLLTESDRMTQDPDTAAVFCRSVKDLGITLDPSHFICGPHAGGPFEQIMKYVCHVRLRDSSKDQLQVRVGQGQVEYGRLINQFNKVGYDRALCVDIAEQSEIDHFAEMRKMRLLLESLT